MTEGGVRVGKMAVTLKGRYSGRQAEHHMSSLGAFAAASR